MFVRFDSNVLPEVYVNLPFGQAYCTYLGTISLLNEVFGRIISVLRMIIRLKFVIINFSNWYYYLNEIFIQSIRRNTLFVFNFGFCIINFYIAVGDCSNFILIAYCPQCCIH